MNGLENFDVYRISLEFHRQAAMLLDGRETAARDQLERASMSIVLNISEGAGRRTPKDQKRFYAIARSSASECRALLDIAAVRGLAEQSDIETARGLLLRAIQMLTRLTDPTKKRTAKTRTATTTRNENVIENVNDPNDAGLDVPSKPARSK